MKESGAAQDARPPYTHTAFVLVPRQPAVSEAALSTRPLSRHMQGAHQLRAALLVERSPSPVTTTYRVSWRERSHLSILTPVVELLFQLLPIVWWLLQGAETHPRANQGSSPQRNPHHPCNPSGK